MTSKMKSQFVLNFSEILADHGDMFFSSGSIDDDYDNIIGKLMVQGYWAGTRLRFFFDPEFNFTGTEERRFGR